MVQNFFTKNKVLLFGLLGAAAVAIKGFIGQPEIQWKAVIFAVVMAILSYIANEWRGQGVTILGILGTLAYTYVQLNQTGTFTWNQFILMSIAAILAAVAPPPKPLTYEKDPVIEKAKENT